jgi:phosphoglycerol transferase MdoB-like AlkP superfamily enzyme
MMNYRNTYKTAPYGESFLFVAETALILLMFTLKLGFFYNYIGIGRFTPVMCAATLAIIMSFYFIIMRLTHFNPVSFLKSIYTVVCVFLFCDRVYYSYLHKMPSFAAVKMADQLTGIPGMVMKLVTIGHAVYILDLPLWLLFNIDFKEHTFSMLAVKGAADRVIRYTRRFTAAFAALCIVFVGGALVRDDFQLSYLKNEILTYHTSDALNQIFGKSAGSDIDALKYMSAGAEQASPYLGIASGRNVITIQVEALQSFVIGLIYNGQEVTPNLNALIAGESLYFNNYYYQVGGGNTADAEFTVNNSLYAPLNEAAYVKYEQNDFYGMPKLLKDNGYSGAYAFHGYKGDFWNREKAYLYQGYDTFTCEKDFNITESFNLGLSDKQFFEQSTKRLITYEQPFYAFMVTLSSHYPYVIPENLRELNILPEDSGTLVSDYLQAIHYLDSSIGLFINDLKAAGLYDNSIISIYGDHYAIPSSDAPSYKVMSRILGHAYYEEDIFKVPFIVNIPGSGINETIGTIGGHIDNLPTMLYLLGIENKKSVMFGQNLLTAKSGVVYEETHMARGSFISDDIIFYYPDNGILVNAVAIDRRTGEPVPSAGYEDIIASARKVYSDCDALLRNNKVVINKTE